MGEFKFYLNGFELRDQPDGWLDFTESIVRDEDLHGFTLLYENNLTFVGDGYDILNRIFLESYCAEVILVVQYRCDGGGFEHLMELLIKITDLDQNLERCTAQAKATDNSYYGMIHNNRDIPVRLSAEYSKNGVPISPCPEVDITFIQPVSDGGFPDTYPSTRMCYRDIDALAFVLRFMSDNRIQQVQSSYFDNLEVLMGWSEIPTRFAFLSGAELRTSTGLSTEVSFAGIMKSMYALHNLFWKVEGTVLILEPYEYFFEGMEMKLPFLRDLMRSTDTQRLYSKVVFGSTKSNDERFISSTYPEPVNWSMPFVDIIAHGKQEYPLTGVCQTDVALNLMSDYIYDSNTIEKVLFLAANLDVGERPDQTYDNDVFYVQYAIGSGSPAIFTVFDGTFLLPTTPSRGWTFNPYFWHSLVINRHNVQSDLSLYQGDSDDNFKATAEAPNAWVGTFQTVLVYLDTALLGDSALSQINTFFQRPSWPNQDFWGGILNNAYNSPCFNPEATCPDPPVNISFNNDSTNGNFDPNDNWNTTDFWFSAPVTGVYGIEVNLIINKLIDQISFPSQPNTYFPISIYGSAGFGSGNPNERVIFNRFVQIVVYFTVFDAFDVPILTTIAPYYGAETEFWEIPDGYFVPSIITAIYGQSNSPIAQDAVIESNYTIAQNTPEQWANDYMVNRQHLMYLDGGAKVRVRLSLRPKGHIKPLSTATRRVKYGVKAGSTIETFYIRSGGGDFAPVDPKLYRSLLYNFDRPLTHQEWKDLKANAAQGVEIGVHEAKTKTHISRINRNIAKGNADFEMMANRNQPFI
jgi:hypothetical protein